MVGVYFSRVVSIHTSILFVTTLSITQLFSSWRLFVLKKTMPGTRCNSCCRLMRLEFHYSRFWLTYRDWKAFAFSPWLPRRIEFQWLYLAYRWCLAAYFFGWLVYSGASGGVKFFIFLTNWCLIMWNTYLVVAAISATIKIISVYCCAGRSSTTTSALLETPDPYIDFDVPVGCCGRDGDTTSWYQKFQWILFYLGVHMAAVVAFLYWSLLYRGGQVDGINVNSHLLNALIGLGDIFISGIPVRILHLIYPMIFSIIYVTFTGIYFAADGTNPNGDPYVYKPLDYGNTPGTAAIYVIVTVVVVVPVLHLLLFGLYSLRFRITRHICNRKIEPTPADPDNYSELD